MGLMDGDRSQGSHMTERCRQAMVFKTRDAVIRYEAQGIRSIVEKTKLEARSLQTRRLLHGDALF